MTSRIVLGTALVLSILAVGVPSASAGPIVDSAESCADQRLAQTFLPWGDIANYTPLRGGNLEGALRGWRLEDGARVVEGNEPFHVGRKQDTRALLLPEGSQVTTAAICVGLGHPAMRFFVKRTSDSLLATLRVEVLFEDAHDAVHALTIAVLAAGAEWQPTPLVPVVVNLLPLLPDDRTAIAFRLTPQDGSFRVDDLYVDPWRAR